MRHDKLKKKKKFIVTVNAMMVKFEILNCFV